MPATASWIAELPQEQQPVLLPMIDKRGNGIAPFEDKTFELRRE
jgi:hypothetical protein